MSLASAKLTSKYGNGKAADAEELYAFQQAFKAAGLGELVVAKTNATWRFRSPTPMRVSIPAWPKTVAEVWFAKPNHW